LKSSRTLFCLCTVAIIVALGVVFVIFKHDSLSNLSNTGAKETYENGFTTSEATLSKPKADGRTKGGGSTSTSGNGVADQKPVHQAMSGGNPTANSSPTPVVPIRFPDGTLVPQPRQLTLEDEVALAKRFLEFYDKDPSTMGVVDRGGSKFFPLYPNTVYVTRKESVNEEGRVYLVGQTSFGVAEVPNNAPIPAGVRVIELSSEGDPIRDYIASGDWREYLLERGLSPTQYEDLLAELDREGYSTEGTNTAVVDAMNDDGTADMGAYPDQTDNLAADNTPSEVEADAPQKAMPVDSEQQLRSLLRQFGLEDEEHRPKKVDAEMTERRDRPPVSDKPVDTLKRSDAAEPLREPKGANRY
jgi:hypothetical protein